VNLDYDAWVTNHSGTTMAIYGIPRIANSSAPVTAFTGKIKQDSKSPEFTPSTGIFTR
jgi:hypothetical protein